MNHVERAHNLRVEWPDQGRWLLDLIVPTLIAALAVTILLAVIVAASKPVWMLLGAGRGFVPEGYYHLWGFVLLFGTLFGQAVGWAGGSVIGYYVMTLVGFRPGSATARLAMSIVYLGLVVFPLSVYHHLYGGWLLSMPRAGLNEWVTANHPGALWLFVTAHPIIDWSLVPLAVLFLGVVWLFGERLERNSLLQTLAALLLLLTSLAVALSLGIHSTLVHIRIGV